MERVAKMQNEVAEILKCSCKNTEVFLQKYRSVVASWPDNPRSAARRAAQDLVSEKDQMNTDCSYRGDD